MEYVAGSVTCRAYPLKLWQARRMAVKADLVRWVHDAVYELGPTNVIGVAKWIWQRHESDLRHSGDLFYTWQYDIRWAAQKLRSEGVLAPTGRGLGSVWRLSDGQ